MADESKKPAQQFMWPTLTPSERYRRVTWEGLLIIQRTDEYVFETLGEKAWFDYSEATRPQWAGPIGGKLVADHSEDFTPDINGGLKLMAVYGVDVWGSGNREKTRISKTNESEGRLTIIDHGCPQWGATSPALRGKFPCHKAYGREVDSVVKRLNPELEVTTIEGRPLGHDDCVWQLRLKPGHGVESTRAAR